MKTKRIIPVIHFLSDEQVYTNIETCLSVGVDNVFIINHLTDYNDLLSVTKKVRKDFPNLWVGLNFLDLSPKEVLEMDLDVDALWFDKTLTLDDVKNKKFKGEIFSGFNFKYQKQYYGDDLIEISNLVKKTSTVACTSGSGTGISANVNRIKNLKDTLGDFPMGLASGVSEDNIESYLPYVDNFLVATSITGKGEIINGELLKRLIEKI
jgi:hypothetical protein